MIFHSILLYNIVHSIIYCMSDQINAALVSLRDIFQKPFKKPYQPQTLDWKCIFYYTIFYNF